jgi:peptide/nickel transport system substrate-binding protein
MGVISKKSSDRKGFLLGTLAVIALVLCVLHIDANSVMAAGDTGKVFVWGRESEYDNLDPHLIYDNSRVGNRVNMYDTLYRWVDNPPELIPWLAESYQVSGEGKKWAFKLRKGIKFHDGSEMTAEDVVYSMERQLALGQGAAPLLKTILDPGTTRAVDKYTVEFNLKKPYAPFISIIPALNIVNPRILKAHEKDKDWGSGWLSSHEAGSGSYQLVDYNPAVGFTMKKFDDHFLGWKGPHFEVVKFKTVREVASRVLALQAGEVDAVDGYLLSEQLEKLEKDPNIKVITEPSMRTFLIYMNNQKPPLTDVHVRRAISYAFDYDGFIKGVLKGKVSRNCGPIPGNLWGAPKDLKCYEYNIEKAKKELAQAKVKVDRPLVIHTNIAYTLTKDAALILQNGLAQLGIELKIEEKTWPTLTANTAKMETTPDMYTVWVSTYYPDPNNWIGEAYNSSQAGTWKSGSWYKNPKMDEILDKALLSTDQGERRKLYEEASRILVDEAVDIFIYNTNWNGPFRKDVMGIRFCPVSNGQEVRWMYWAEDAKK